jgi:hypothetical protein
MQDGTVYEERVLQNRGGPGNPLSEGELREKFTLNAGQLLPRERVERLADAILALEGADDVGAVLALSRVTPSARDAHDTGRASSAAAPAR